MINNIPPHAIPVTFMYGAERDGTFYIWETRGGNWQWDAFSNCGEEATMNEAIAAARTWIKDNYTV